MNTTVRLIWAYILIAPVIITSCAGKNTVTGESRSYKKPVAYNLKFIGFDYNIGNPESDRRSYYKVFIDKIEAGRTTTGLESQEKSFEATISDNRHLLTVEKWVLDEKMEKYIKLNNIDQPKPGFIYFGVPENRIVIIILKNDAEINRAVFDVEYERE